PASRGPWGICRPRPRLPPVTRATLPSRRRLSRTPIAGTSLRWAGLQLQVPLDGLGDSWLELRDVDRVAKDAGGRRDAKLGDAARINQVEMGKVGLQVDREAVQRDAVALGNADRGDLAAVAEHADVAVLDVRGDAQLTERVDDRIFERAHVAGDGELSGSHVDDG